MARPSQTLETATRFARSCPLVSTNFLSKPAAPLQRKSKCDSNLALGRPAQAGPRSCVETHRAARARLLVAADQNPAADSAPGPGPGRPSRCESTRRSQASPYERRIRKCDGKGSGLHAGRSGERVGESKTRHIYGSAIRRLGATLLEPRRHPTRLSLI